MRDPDITDETSDVVAFELPAAGGSGLSDGVDPSTVIRLAYDLPH